MRCRISTVLPPAEQDRKDLPRINGRAGRALALSDPVRPGTSRYVHAGILHRSSPGVKTNRSCLQGTSARTGDSPGRDASRCSAIRRQWGLLSTTAPLTRGNEPRGFPKREFQTLGAGERLAACRSLSRPSDRNLVAACKIQMESSGRQTPKFRLIQRKDAVSERTRWVCGPRAGGEPRPRPASRSDRSFKPANQAPV